MQIWVEVLIPPKLKHTSNIIEIESWYPFGKGILLAGWCDAQSLGTDAWCACLIFCLPSHSCKTSYPSLECACCGRTERPQMVYANDNTSLIHQIKSWRNRYPWAHPVWFVEWSSTWWPMHLWPGLPQLTAISMDKWWVVVDKSPWLEMLKNIIGSRALVH